MQVSALDHLVLRVRDANRALAWYTGVLGLTAEREDDWRGGAVPFPSVRVDAGTVIDLLEQERTGENVDHFCLVVEDVDMDALAASGRFDVVEGPAARWGARGEGIAVYVRDPDGNIVELRSYSDTELRSKSNTELRSKSNTELRSKSNTELRSSSNTGLRSKSNTELRSNSNTGLRSYP